MTREISSRAKLEVAEVVLLTDDVMLDPQDVRSGLLSPVSAPTYFRIDTLLFFHFMF